MPTRKDLRTFAVDAIRQARVTEAPAREVPDAALDRVLGAGYGIFAGAETETAVLRFTPDSALGRRRGLALEAGRPHRGRWQLRARASTAASTSS